MMNNSEKHIDLNGIFKETADDYDDGMDEFENKNDNNPAAILREHNREISKYENAGMYSNALEVCCKALEIFPQNIGLIGQYIGIAWKALQFDLIHHGIGLLQKINPSQWQLRVCETAVRALVGEQLHSSEDIARSLIEKRRRFHPCEESFYLEYVLQDAMGNRNAFEILQTAVEKFNAPVCTQALARILIDNREADKAAEIITRALAFSEADCVPLLYMLCRVEDARLIMALSTGTIPPKTEFSGLMNKYMQLRFHAAFRNGILSVNDIENRYEFLRLLRNGLYPDREEKEGDKFDPPHDLVYGR